MNFTELAKNRYSVRQFLQKSLSQSDIDAILDAGHVAPTACNNQPQKIFVINTPSALEKMRRCTSCHFEAPCAMLICYDKELSWKREFDGKNSGDIDASILTTHMMLAAHERGIGSVWVMYFIPEAVKVEFALADTIEPVALLMLGYPDENAKPSPQHTRFRDKDLIVEYL